MYCTTIYPFSPLHRHTILPHPSLITLRGCRRSCCWIRHVGKADETHVPPKCYPATSHANEKTTRANTHNETPCAALAFNHPPHMYIRAPAVCDQSFKAVLQSLTAQRWTLEPIIGQHDRPARFMSTILSHIWIRVHMCAHIRIRTRNHNTQRDR